MRQRLTLTQAAVGLGVTGVAGGDNGGLGRERHLPRQPAGHGRGCLRGVFCAPGQAASATLSASAAGARRQSGPIALRRAAARFNLPFEIAAVPRSIWLNTWYALSASVFCLWVWYRGLPEVKAWLAGLTTAAIPVTALAGSTLLLAGRIEAWRLTGGGLVLAAIVLGVSQRRAKCVFDGHRPLAVRGNFPHC